MAESALKLRRLADQCVACGLCVPGCPTYRKTGSEADSPRGRIALIKGVLEARIPANPRFIEHIDLCLVCRACERVCPNHVRFGELMDGAREHVHGLRPALARFFSRISGTLVARPKLLQSLAPFAALARAAKLHLLFPKSKRGEVKVWLASAHARSRFRERYPAYGERRGEVALFLGCVARVFDLATLRSAILVLNRQGYDVRVPKSQTCCGALARHAGDLSAAAKLAQRNVEAFQDASIVITTASGCEVALSEYGRDYGAHEFCGKIVDVCDLVARGWRQEKLTPLETTIAVHRPCTMRGRSDRILEKIPGVVIRALPGNDQCCGAAGTYFLTQPKMANALREDKINAIAESGVELVATANFGCALHMKAAGINTLHPITLLARQT